MTNRPLISICINSHNEGFRLKSTVEAIRANLGDWPHEFIVVADGTTDGSADDLGQDVTVIKTKKPIGCGKSKVEAVKIAVGKILVFFDAHQNVLLGSISEMCMRAFEDGCIWTPVIRNIGYTDDKPFEKNTKNHIPNDAGLGYNAKQYRKESDEWAAERHGTNIGMVGVGFAITPETLAAIGGFSAFEGRHGSQERCISLRAFCTKVPIKLDSKLILGHEFRGSERPRGYQRYTRVDQAKNLWHTYYVVSRDKVFEQLRPILGGLAAKGGNVINLQSVKDERNAFSVLNKRTDEELLVLLQLAAEASVEPTEELPTVQNISTAIPYAQKGVAIGVEYNRIMNDAKTPWVLLLDHDVFMLHPNWYRVCQEAIKQQPSAGMFSCYTNNIGCKRQKCAGSPEGDDIAVHKAFARQRWEAYRYALTPNKTHYIGGFFMLVNKAAWKEAGGFVETGFYGVDNDFHKRLLDDAHRMVYQIEGLYCYHERNRKDKAWIEGEFTSFDRTKKTTREEINRSGARASNRTVIYTVITGNYDKIPERPNVPDSWDCILFSDIAVDAPGWDVKTFDTEGLDNVRASRLPKILPHKYLPDHDYSVYIDANMKITARIENFLSRSSWPDFGITRHGVRRCVFEEAGACIKQFKDTPEAINAQMVRYDGMPVNAGLTANGVLARRHHAPKVKVIADLWWNEYVNAESIRDQLSLPYVLWKHGIKLHQWSETERMRFFSWTGHVKARLHKDYGGGKI